MTAVIARRFALSFVILFTTMAAANAAAASHAVRGQPANGCAQLSDVVSSAMQTTLRMQWVDPYLWPKHYQLVPTAIADRPVSCGTTAAVTSAAFSATLASYGFDVGWNNGAPGHPGDQCLSHYISQCYPEFRTGRSVPTGTERSFVKNAWLGVQSGVSLHMPFGPLSDLVYFEPTLLDATLATSLAVSLSQSERRGRVDTDPAVQ